MVSKIGILHPGAMGVSVAASAQTEDQEVCWAGRGRSAASHARAAEVRLTDLGTVDALCTACDVILSVCPPHAAEDVAASVAQTGFSGLYLDGNAISPRRARAVQSTLALHGIDYVDGGIIGGPAWERGKTWLYLSGPRADEIARLFRSGPLETEVLGPEIDTASALKMCFAAYTKGTTALLAAILAAAEELNVRDALARQWSRNDAGFAAEADRRVRNVTAKAWRFAGEMDEIAATFAGAGLPGEFHTAAGIIYRRLADFKDAESTPELADVLVALRTAE